MISLLRGTLRHRSPFTIVVEAGGVGYEILCTQEAYARASTIGDEVEMWTRLIVREDSMTLFGFSGEQERALFDLLITISGIGPKTAIGILSGIGEEPLREAIRASDVHRLIGIPGIGRKTAERMIVELRDKLLKEEIISTASTPTSKIRGDALQAMLALGYQRAAAEKAIRDVLRDQLEVGTNVEKLIKAALKQASNS